jgi:hypothetical protein
MDWNRDLYNRCARLQRTSATLRAEAAALRAEQAGIRARLDVPPAPVAEPSAAYASDWPGDNPRDAAMEILRVIRAMIDPFPLLWQIAIVQALTARTILFARDQAHLAPSALSA